MIDLESILDLTAAQIQQITAEAYRELIARIMDAGDDPQRVIAEIQARWAGKYEERLTEAFSAVLGRAVGAGEVRALPIGDIVLSDYNLYKR